jgi:hypothetical protein
VLSPQSHGLLLQVLEGFIGLVDQFLDSTINADTNNNLLRIYKKLNFYCIDLSQY